MVLEVPSLAIPVMELFPAKAAALSLETVTGMGSRAIARMRAQNLINIWRSGGGWGQHLIDGILVRAQGEALAVDQAPAPVVQPLGGQPLACETPSRSSIVVRPMLLRLVLGAALHKLRCGEDTLQS